MLLYWYAYISMNTNLSMIYDMSLETIWWAISNTSLIIEICSVISEIKLIITDGVIS